MLAGVGGLGFLVAQDGTNWAPRRLRSAVRLDLDGNALRPWR